MGTAVGREVRYLSLGELAGALVLAVADQFDDAALVGGEAGWWVGWSVTGVVCFVVFVSGGVGLGSGWGDGHLLLCKACCSVRELGYPDGSSPLPVDNTLFSRQGIPNTTHPATSLTMDRTNCDRLLDLPLLCDGRGLETRGVVF